ncbi:MAG: AMP-binding protein [Actinobacteria bacterium]|nr:AMP-binding protein [Actinomycetota bacterium]
MLSDASVVERGGVTALLHDRATRDPDRVLVRFDRDWSLGEIAALSERVAARLVQAGVRRGSRVAVMLPNEVWWPVCWFAIARVGAVMVPVNVAYRVEDLRHVLIDSSAMLVIASSRTMPVVAEVTASIDGLDVVTFESGTGATGISTSWAAVGSDEPPPPAVLGGLPDGASLLSLQYTSGTTGFPKACMLEHRYWYEVGQVAVEHASLNAVDVILTTQPFSYMDPQWNVIAALISGATLVVLPRFSPRTFWPAVRDHGVTWCYMVGTMPVFLASLPDARERPADSLRFVTCSGIVPEMHAEFERRWKVPWREAYGMTETGVDLACAVDATWTVGSGHLGDVVPGKEMRIVGDREEVVDGPGSGELQVRGRPMMLGYWNRPDDEQVIDADGWLHTGDIVERSADGALCLVGRSKDMIRRAGENVAAAEVEAVMVLHPGVVAVAVVGVPDRARGEEVKAFVQCGPNRPEPSALHQFAADRLAAFKVPRYIEYVDSFPMTSSERIAKHQLVHGDAWDAVAMNAGP